jgi:hypothetical protein
MYLASIFENKRMKLVEVVLRKNEGGKRVNDGGGKSKTY